MVLGALLVSFILPWLSGDFLNQKLQLNGFTLVDRMGYWPMYLAFLAPVAGLYFEYSGKKQYLLYTGIVSLATALNFYFIVIPFEGIFSGVFDNPDVKSQFHKIISFGFYTYALGSLFLVFRLLSELGYLNRNQASTTPKTNNEARGVEENTSTSGNVGTSIQGQIPQLDRRTKIIISTVALIALFVYGGYEFWKRTRSFIIINNYEFSNEFKANPNLFSEKYINHEITIDCYLNYDLEGKKLNRLSLIYPKDTDIKKSDFPVFGDIRFDTLLNFYMHPLFPKISFGQEGFKNRCIYFPETADFMNLDDVELKPNVRYDSTDYVSNEYITYTDLDDIYKIKKNQIIGHNSMDEKSMKLYESLSEGVKLHSFTSANISRSFICGVYANNDYYLHRIRIKGKLVKLGEYGDICDDYKRKLNRFNNQMFDGQLDLSKSDSHNNDFYDLELQDVTVVEVIPEYNIDEMKILKWNDEAVSSQNEDPNNNIPDTNNVNVLDTFPSSHSGIQEESSVSSNTSNIEYQKNKTGIIVDEKTYIYSAPSEVSQKKGYLIKGDHIYIISDSANFYRVEYVNPNGDKYDGWLKRNSIRLNN